jgi:lipoprotein Spr
MKDLRFLFFCLILFGFSSCGIFKKKSSSKGPVIQSPRDSELLIKYSKIIGQSVTNKHLYRVIDGWMGVPYKFAGKSKDGIDCSHFTCQILRSGFQFPSDYYFPSSRLAEQGEKQNLDHAKEGDLVFFSMNQTSKVSHVGVFLANRKFVHASTSKGVIISSLDEEYYKKRFHSIRRMK